MYSDQQGVSQMVIFIFELYWHLRLVNALQLLVFEISLNQKI